MRPETNRCQFAKMPESILDLRYSYQNKLLRVRCKHRVKEEIAILDLLNKKIHPLNNLNAGSGRSNVFYLSVLLLLYSCVLIRATTTILPEGSTRAFYDGNSSDLPLPNILHQNRRDGITSYRKEENLKPNRVTRDVSNVPDDDDDSSYRDDEMDEYDTLINNKSGKCLSCMHMNTCMYIRHQILQWVILLARQGISGLPQNSSNETLSKSVYYWLFIFVPLL